MREEVHPAILELKRFLSLQGDMQTQIFMKNWITAWLQTAEYNYKMPDQELDHYRGNKEDLLTKIDEKAYSALGLAFGRAGCVHAGKETEIPEEPGVTNYGYRAIILRNKKKLQLVDK